MIYLQLPVPGIPCSYNFSFEQSGMDNGCREFVVGKYSSTRCYRYN